MTSQNFREMLARVKQGGRLSDAELNVVRVALQSGTTDEDPYTLLHIIGKAGDQRLATLVSRYLAVGLDSTKDGAEEDDGVDMMRRLAIQILGQWWKRKDVFEWAAQAAFRDPSPMVRAMAASTLGDLGLAHAELRDRAAALLLEGLERHAGEQREVWGSFYEGALTLAEVEHSKRPLRPGELRPADVDQMVLKRLQSYAGSPARE